MAQTPLTALQGNPPGRPLRPKWSHRQKRFTFPHFPRRLGGGDSSLNKMLGGKGEKFPGFSSVYNRKSGCPEIITRARRNQDGAERLLPISTMPPRPAPVARRRATIYIQRVSIRAILTVLGSGSFQPVSRLTFLSEGASNRLVSKPLTYGLTSA